MLAHTISDGAKATLIYIISRDDNILSLGVYLQWSGGRGTKSPTFNDD